MNKNITATILIVLAIGIYLTVTEKILDQAKVVKIKNDEYVTALDKADQLIRVREKVLKEFNDISDVDRQRLDKMLPSAVDNIRLVIDLNTLAVTDGVQLASVSATTDPSKDSSPSQPTDPNAPSRIATQTLDTVSVTFTSTATMSAFSKFMKDMESSLRIMDLTSLTVTPVEGGKFNFNVKMKTYWLRQ
jgi:Tfp pilus assembly protein PilO